MLGHQGVTLFERTGRCGLDGGSRSLRVDFEALETLAKSIVSLFLLPAYLDVKVSATMSTYMPPCSLS